MPARWNSNVPLDQYIDAVVVTGSANAGATPVPVKLTAGATIVGTVGIDQTTPGTTNGVQVNAALPAGTNTIGATLSVVTAPTQSSVTPTATPTAYVAGYALGASGANAVQSFTIPTSGILQNFGMGLSSGTYTGTIDLILFKSAPSAYTDGAAANISAADMAKILQVVHLTDNTSLGGTLAFVQAIGTAISYNFGTTIYVLPIIRGANTFASSSTVTLAFEVVQ